MKILPSVISLFLVVNLVVAPPPRRNEKEEKNTEDVSKEKDVLEDFGLEYNRYLKEVVDLLESDAEFKKKLEDAHETDIRNGMIAKELEFVSHNIRSKLDEVKRQEIERLRHLAQKQYELTNGIDTEHVKVSSEHLDHENPHTFEIEDLKKLIAKVSSDLNAADEKRRNEFKEYEMQKEFERQEKLKRLQGSEREAFEKQLKENETKHKQHEPLHHPGSKQQLEEVWEKQDHMENQEFNPKIFFQLHDLDGNGFWDHNEVKTLFLKELDKMYEAGAPEDDMRERLEEMERMREHVFGEADKNRDGLLSYEEFVEKTKQPDFEKDSGWESLDQKPVYTPEEYREFERRRREEIEKLIQQGLIPPQPVFHPGQGYHPQPQYVQYHQPQYQGHQQGYPSQDQPPYRYAQDYPASQQVHPGQVQHGYQNQQQLHQQQQQQQHHQPQGFQGQQHGQAPLSNASPTQQPHGQMNQAYQQPAQGHPNQAYQQPQQGHPNQAYQQPQQGHPNQAYQQPQQGHPNQAYQQPQQGHPNQGYQQHSEGFQGRDPNEIRPIDTHQTDSKYSKEGGSVHPNVIDSQQNKVEQKSNEHPSKSSK